MFTLVARPVVPNGSRPMNLVRSSRETVRADCAVEGDEKLALPCSRHALHLTDEPCSLRKQKLLVVVGVVIGGEHHDHGAVETAIDVVRQNTFEHCAFEHAVEPSLIAVKVVLAHRVTVLWRGLRDRPGDWLRRIALGYALRVITDRLRQASLLPFDCAARDEELSLVRIVCLPSILCKDSFASRNAS